MCLSRKGAKEIRHRTACGVPLLCEHATREFDDRSLQPTPTRHTAPAQKTSRDRQGVGQHANPALTLRARQTRDTQPRRLRLGLDKRTKSLAIFRQPRRAESHAGLSCPVTKCDLTPLTLHPCFLCVFAPLREDVFVTQRRKDAKEIRHRTARAVLLLCEHATREFYDRSLQPTPTRYTAPAPKTSRDRQGVGHHANPALTLSPHFSQCNQTEPLESS